MVGPQHDPAPEVPWDRVALSFRRARSVKRAMLVLALLVVVIGVLVQLF